MSGMSVKDFLDSEFAYPMVESPDLDKLVIEKVGAAHLKPELSLFTKKWYDYRELHPAIATAFFAQCYKKAHSDVIHRRVDMSIAPWKQGIAPKALLFDHKPTNLTGLWKARQTADRMCIPYEFFCRTILSYAERTHWKNLPRPTQLYRKDILEMVNLAWFDEIKRSVQVAELDRYKAINYTGERDQKQYAYFLILQAGMRPNKSFILNSLIKRHGALHEQVARRYFGDREVDKALSLSL